MMKYKKMFTIVAAVVLALGLFCSQAPPASAAVYGFEAITNNTGNSSLWDDYFQLVTSGNATMDFTLTNNFGVGDPNAGVISEIYFYVTSQAIYDMMAFNSMTASPGVAFSAGATPPNLPGYAGATAYSFTYDANNPSPHNGVNPAEFITITFDWTGPGTLDDLLMSGDLVVGMHLQSLGLNEGSESVINTASTPIPGAVFLLGSGLLGMIPFARRRRR